MRRSALPYRSTVSPLLWVVLAALAACGGSEGGHDSAVPGDGSAQDAHGLDAMDGAPDVATDVVADASDAFDASDTADVTDAADALDAADASDASDASDAADVVEAGCDGSVCGSSCVNLQTDVHHCGSCDTDCTGLANVDGAQVRCVAGACDLTGACLPGHGHCSSDVSTGCETDLSDPAHCGTCTTACAEPTPVCGRDSTGAFACTSGCTAPASTRCAMSCINVQTDPAHCGSCTTACPDPTNGHATCASGSCGVACDPTFHACGSSCSSNTDVNSCGSSCTPCTTPPHATATCDGTSCGFTCAAGYADCDGNAANGCEANIGSDPNHCGSCTNVCMTPNGMAQCVGSMCTVASCSPGFSDCDHNAANGCEVRLINDPLNCGMCGMVCPSLPHAVTECAGGMCGIVSCTPGYMDCDGDPANGCEVNVGADPNNCGGCGQHCTVANGVPGCMAGSCTIASCNAGFTDCDGVVTTGCETHTSTDPNNCGSCHFTCNAMNGTAGCAGGSCTIAGCNTGFANCDGNVGNGCETNTTNSVGNCGACGNNCQTMCSGSVTATQCNSSTCSILACAAGAYNIDNVCGNGCECHSTGTPTSCGVAFSLGTIALGGTPITYTGNLVPAGQEAYLSVTFGGTGDTNYHPHIRLTNGTSEFAFDVVASCGATGLSCGEGGTANSTGDWEVSFTGMTPGNTNPIPAVGTNGTVYIHVFRRAGQPVSCNSYTLTISN